MSSQKQEQEMLTHGVEGEGEHFQGWNRVLGEKIGRDLISPSSFQLRPCVKRVFLLSLIPGELILQIT